MKKFFIFLSFVSVLNAEIATKEFATKYGEQVSIPLNMDNRLNYQEKIDSCNNIFDNSGTLNFDNRKKMLPIAIKACQDNIKK